MTKHGPRTLALKLALIFWALSSLVVRVFLKHLETQLHTDNEVYCLLGSSLRTHFWGISGRRPASANVRVLTFPAFKQTVLNM